MEADAPLAHPSFGHMLNTKCLECEFERRIPCPPEPEAAEEASAEVPADWSPDGKEAMEVDRKKKKQLLPPKSHGGSHRKFRRRGKVKAHEKLFSQREQHAVYAGNDAAH